MFAALFGLWNACVLAVWLHVYHPTLAPVLTIARRLAVPGRFSFTVLAANWSAFALACLVAGGLLACAESAGRRTRRWARVPGGEAPATLLPGLGLLGLAMLAAGLTGLLFAPARPLASGALALLGFARVRRLVAGCRAMWPSATPGEPGVSLVAVMAVTVAAGLALAGVMGPETGWDALMYHLRLPSFYLMHHKVYGVRHAAPYGEYPAQVEMLYTLAGLVAGDQCARILNGVLVALVGLVTLGFVGELGGGRSARGAALLIVAGCPTLLALVPRAYVDPGCAAFAAAGCLELLRWRRTGARASLVLAGGLAGFAMGSKYIGVFALPGGLAVLLGCRRRGVALAGAALAFPLLPWLLKNWLFTGNPVSPFAGVLFGTPVALAAETTLLGPLGAVAALPARLKAFLLDGGHLDSPLTPALAGLLPLLSWREPDPLRRAARLASGGWILAWALAAPEARFVLPAVPVLAALLAARLGAMSGTPAGRVGRWALTAHSLAAAGWAAALAWTTLDPLAMPLGLITARARLSAGLPPAPEAYAARDAVTRLVPPGDRVLVASHFATYYADRECLAEFHAGGSKLARILRAGANEAGIAVGLRRLGVRWVLAIEPGASYLDQPGFYDVPASGWAGWASLLRRRGEIAWQADRHALIRLGMTHAPRPLPVLPVYETVAFRAADRAREAGRLDEALAAYERPPALLRGVGSTWLRIALVRHAAGDLAGAETAYRAALAAGLDTVPLRHGLAEALLARDEAAAALPHAEAAWAARPGSALVAFTLARIHHALGRDAVARAWIGEAVRAQPEVELFRRMAAILGPR